MTGPWPDIAHTYDVAAEHYAATFAGELAGKPFDRDLLDRYAAALAGRGEVWDVGCGAAGHLTRYLADRGAEVSGADVSPGSVAVARRCQPGLRFRVADMCGLPAGDGSLAGIVAFYSLIHLPRPRIPVALAEFRRVLPSRRCAAGRHARRCRGDRLRCGVRLSGAGSRDPRIRWKKSPRWRNPPASR